MKLTLSVSYAIGVLLQIQEHAGNGQLTAARISRGCRFPRRFLYRVLHKLVDAGLISGVSGPGGGYALARRPEDITLLDVAASVDCRPQSSKLMPVCARQRSAIQHVNQLCRQNATRFAAELSRVSLADLERLSARGQRGAQAGKTARARR
jgi:Rrf2 family protein